MFVGQLSNLAILCLFFGQLVDELRMASLTTSELRWWSHGHPRAHRVGSQFINVRMRNVSHHTTEHTTDDLLNFKWYSQIPWWVFVLKWDVLGRWVFVWDPWCICCYIAEATSKWGMFDTESMTPLGHISWYLLRKLVGVMHLGDMFSFVFLIAHRFLSNTGLESMKSK